MRRIRALSRSPVLAATSFACVLLAGCRTWRPSELPLVELVAERPGSLRVYDRAGDDHVLDSPRIEQDSLVSSDYMDFADGSRLGERIALEDITAVEERKYSEGRTVVVALGMTGALVVAFVLEAFKRIPGSAGDAPPDDVGEGHHEQF